MKTELLKSVIERLENLKIIANSHEQEFGIDLAINEVYAMLEE